MSYYNVNTLFNHSRYMKDQLCNLNTDQAIEVFKIGYTKFMNDTPSKKTLAIIVAQSALETGWWKAGLHCWNFGNTRCNPDKLSEDEYFTMFKCGEIIKGKEVFFIPPDPKSVFQAFESAEAGVRHHLRFLSTKNNYRNAWAQAVKQNPDQYIIELKKAGYFTAGLERYKKTFMSVYNTILAKIEDDKFEITDGLKNQITTGVDDIIRNR